EAFAAAWRERSPDHPWLVAEVDGEVVAYAKATRWRDRAAYARTVETTVYVAPEYTGRGHGRAVYGELLRQLRMRAFRTAIGGITLPNPASVRLHEDLGFKHVGTFR